MAVIETKECMFCGKTGKVEVTDAELFAYKTQPGFIQNVLPRLSEGEREMLISGTHSECFDAMFGEDED